MRTGTYLEDNIIKYDDNPVRYKNNVNTTTPTVSGTWVNYGTGGSSVADSNNCPVEITYGNILFSESVMRFQKSCEPHAYNAGNYYNLPSQLGEAKFNNLCPKGWMLPDSGGSTSYSNFLMNYGIDNSATKDKNTHDAALINMPLSFLRSGDYNPDGSLAIQGSSGIYRMTSLRLSFNSGDLNPTNDTRASYGYSVRCVSR